MSRQLLVSQPIPPFKQSKSYSKVSRILLWTRCFPILEPNKRTPRKSQRWVDTLQAPTLADMEDLNLMVVQEWKTSKSSTLTKMLHKLSTMPINNKMLKKRYSKSSIPKPTLLRLWEMMQVHKDNFKRLWLRSKACSLS